MLVLNEQTRVLVLAKDIAIVSAIWFQKGHLRVLTTVIDEGPCICSIHNSTFCCCFSPTYCLCWSIFSCRKPNVYISSLLNSPHSILKSRKYFWHCYSFITDTVKLWDIMRLPQERKMFIFDFSFLDPLRLFASYFQLLPTSWKASKSVYLMEA